MLKDLLGKRFDVTPPTDKMIEIARRHAPTRPQFYAIARDNDDETPPPLPGDYAEKQFYRGDDHSPTGAVVASKT